MAIQLIAIDLDGTLLNEHQQLNPATIDAIQRAKAQGIKVVLCSGRPLTGVRPFLEQLNLTEAGDFVIAYNGAMVQHADTGDTIAAETISYADYQRLVALADDLGVHMQALDEHSLYTHNADISHYTVREAWMVNIPLFYRTPDSFPADKRFVKVMLIDEPAALDVARAQVPQAIRDDYYLVDSEPFFLEVMHKGVNKGHAVTTLAEYLNIPMSDVMTIGDQANDLPMIEVAGLGVAMGNAIPEVKAAAKIETATNREDGVAQAIVKYAIE